MRRRVFLIFMVSISLIAMAGCQHRESAITGNYGTQILTAQVVMASEMAGSTPAGVEVNVVGTGMSATLAADGRFTFVGVPLNAELTFRRAGDVNARLSVPPGPSQLVIELSADGAKSVRRRSAAPGRTQQYEGLIVGTPTLTELVVHDSHNNDVTFALTPATADTPGTVIRKGQQPVVATDLNEGDRVHVKALMREGVLTALEVIVQDQNGDDGEDEGGMTMTANGVVTGRDGTTLTVLTEPRGEITVQTDENTIIRKQGEIVGVDAIRVNLDEVNTMGTKVDDHTLLARQIEVRGNGKRG